MTPPGWYTDPHDPSQMRWWDGSAWGEQTAPGVQPAAPVEQVEPVEQWGVPRTPAQQSQYFEMPQSPVQPTRNRSLGRLLLVVLVVGVAVIAVLATRDDDGGGAAAPTTTVASEGGMNAGPDADLALIETCRFTKKTIATALQAWSLSGGSSNPADSHPVSGYPMTLALLAASDARLLVDAPNEADWEYDPAVGESSLRAKAGGSYDQTITLICNAG